MHRDILHVDMDAYFASIEQRDLPIYRGRPLLVCHTDDPRTYQGVVSAASYEARPYGVKSGISVLEAKRLCPKGVYLAGNYDKYLYNTKKLVAICRRFTDLVEVYSVDEMFLDVTKTKRFFGGHPLKVAVRLQRAIRERLNLSASIGIGPNKLVAKMASEFNKPSGITLIEPDDLPGVFSPLPIDRLVGIGSRMKRHLEAIGVRTLGDLARVSSAYLEKKFGVVGLWLKQAALGVDHTPVVSSEEAIEVKSFGHSSALGGGEGDLGELEKILLGLVEGVTRRLRREKYVGRTVTLRLCLARLMGYSRSHTIGRPTDLTGTVYPIARMLLRREAGMTEKYPATLIGVSVSNLNYEGDERQMSIDDLLNNSEARLAAVTDALKDKYGERIIMRATLLNWKRRYHQVSRTAFQGYGRGRGPAV